MEPRAGGLRVYSPSGPHPRSWRISPCPEPRTGSAQVEAGSPDKLSANEEIDLELPTPSAPKLDPHKLRANEETTLEPRALLRKHRCTVHRSESIKSYPRPRLHISWPRLRDADGGGQASTHQRENSRMRYLTMSQAGSQGAAQTA